MSINLKNKKIWVTGATGMVGSSLTNILKKKNFKIFTPNRKTLNLTDKKKVFNWVKKNKPDVVFMTAAKVGGIYANDKYPAEFMYENIQIQNNIIEASKYYKIKKLIFIGSSCIYPRNCKQPIKENYLLSGKLETTNQWYAIAKISGIKMVQAYRKQYGCNFISVMPCNMYGPKDNYEEKNSHVMAALIKKFSLAKKNNKKNVVVWGTGKPLREFMYVDDFCRALLLVAEKYNSDEPINIGTGQEISILKLAILIAKLTGYKNKIVFDKKYPDGTPRKILDSKKIRKFGWRPFMSLDNGIQEAIWDFSKNN